MQVHNLVDWREHLEMLFTMKAAGEIEHIGITTSNGRRHELLERIMREYPLDFVQLTYNILDRGARGAALAAGARPRHRRDGAGGGFAVS